ncbi:MAG: putative toxin-antitoxin system toxin component, PIN family [Rubrobacter sp.]|nr:putative toxin-antitoxin system toxin component, PIN family [Rubrobacter sp.]
MGARPTIVLDTNVLVSALGWRGNERLLYERCRSGELQLATSNALLDELRRVLRYPKLGFTEDEIEEFVSDILLHALMVSPSRTLEVISEDPDDDRVLECAIQSDVCWIVSGDRHLLDLGSYESVTISTALAAANQLPGGD